MAKLSEMKLKTAGARLTPAAPRLRYARSEGGVAAAHYQTPEHRAWRAAVLKRDGYRCVRCGARGAGVRLFADHVVEIEDRGAALDVDNGQTLCGAHHNEKTAASRAARG